METAGGGGEERTDAGRRVRARTSCAWIIQAPLLSFRRGAIAGVFWCLCWCLALCFLRNGLGCLVGVSREHSRLEVSWMPGLEQEVGMCVCGCGRCLGDIKEQPTARPGLCGPVCFAVPDSMRRTRSGCNGARLRFCVVPVAWIEGELSLKRLQGCVDGQDTALFSFVGLVANERRCLSAAERRDASRMQFEASRSSQPVRAGEKKKKAKTSQVM
jgi:hypothetical protein